MYSFVGRLAVCAVLWITALAAIGSPRADHVFIISIDGGKPAVIAQSDMPVLKQLVREGAWTLGCKHDLPKCDAAFSHLDAHRRGSRQASCPVE